MLNKLSIHNYAIIKDLDIEFSPQLNVITGETGAGKSILVGALGLILGERAESSVLLNHERKCIVEGWFRDEGKNEEVLEFLRLNELDINDDLVVRREIAPNGKSRAFINDTPVNLGQLNQLSSLLVDLHQQFDTLEIGEAHFQLKVLDALASNASLLNHCKLSFNKAQQLKVKLNELKEQKARFEKEFDYNQFQYNELEEASFRENELEHIEHEIKMLSNAEDIKNVLAKAYNDLEENEEPIVKQLKSIVHSLHQYADLHEQFPLLADRVQSCYIELKDIAGELDHLNNGITSDAVTLDKLNERLSLGYHLLKKHNVKTTNELLSVKQELSDKLKAVLDIDDAIAEAERKYNEHRAEAESVADKLSAARNAQVSPLEKQVNKLLAQVGMPNARLKIQNEKKPLSETGYDNIVFLFDGNKSNRFLPLQKVASGGELSRLMLCIKWMVAKSMDLPTLIFDEIDTGISGEAAKQVGILMKQLAGARQVISITHQPQIAGKADAHFYVYKSVEKDTINTNVRRLDMDERIVTIAKMLSGEKPTAAALENAREIVMN
ncbi:MAG: DNA repair protein RecN [Candidatus Dadabacteria bacterium]